MCHVAIVIQVLHEHAFTGMDCFTESGASTTIDSHFESTDSDQGKQLHDANKDIPLRTADILCTRQNSDFSKYGKG